MNLPQRQADDPVVSVVIPVYNCEKFIGKCLQSLAVLNHPDYEVIVIDGGSIDRTRQVCSEYPWVRLLCEENAGVSRSRNIGIKMARGNFIAFTDGDCIADPEWLGQLEKLFADPRVAGVGGDQLSPEDESEKGAQIHAFMKAISFSMDYVKNIKSICQTDHNPTCNVMYRKSVLDEVGGFDESLRDGEDLDLDLQIRRRGYCLLYNPNAIVRHYRPNSYHAYARKMRRYGSGQADLVRRYGKFRVIHRLPLLLAISLFLTVCLLILVPRVWPVFLLLLLVPFCCFWLRSGSIVNGISLCYLLFVTIVFWNVGYLTGTKRKTSVR